jgi:ATP phosphoribosyltransferase
MTLRVAVPDGRLEAPSLELLAAAGALGDDGGARVEHDVTVITLAAPDVPTYVARGAADAGFVAKDVLLEHDPGLCELLDLRFGRALLVYAAASSAAERARRLGRLRVATRHPALTRSYFAGRGVAVQVVRLEGKLDRAAIEGLADGVVALVDEGDDAVAPPLAGLSVEATVASSSVRLVAGRGARALRTAELGALVTRLRAVVAERGAS